MTELPTPSTQIDPYMNPVFWEGHALGDGDAKQLQRPSTPNTRNQFTAIAELMKYASMGAGKLALSRLTDGHEFNADNYKPGTIIRTTQESLALDSGNSS